jgi:hypothetical protein
MLQMCIFTDMFACMYMDVDVDASDINRFQEITATCKSILSMDSVAPFVSTSRTHSLSPSSPLFMWAMESMLISMMSFPS